MSEAHVAQFAAMAAKDPALLARLGVEQVTDEATARICASKAVSEAKAAGLELTEAEAYEWIKRGATGTDELTDTQLEAVAGGIIAAGYTPSTPPNPSPRSPRTSPRTSSSSSSSGGGGGAIVAATNDAPASGG